MIDGFKIGVQIRKADGIGEYFDLAASRGFDCMEILTAQSPAEADGFFEKADEFREHSQRCGLRLMVHCGPISFLTYPDARVREAVWTSVKDHVEFVRRAGAARMSFHSPVYGNVPAWPYALPAVGKDDKPDFVPMKAAREDYREKVRELYELSLEAGVRLAVENSLAVPGLVTCLCVYPDEIEDLVGAADMDILLDTGHANITGLPVELFVERFGSRLRQLHLHDNDGVRDSHLLPGCGSIRFEPVFERLKSAGFDGDVILECVDLLEDAASCERVLGDIARWVGGKAS